MEATKKVRDLTARVGFEARLTYRFLAAAVVTLPENSLAVIVPCTFDPNKEGSFRLALLSQKSIRVYELKDEAKEVRSLACSRFVPFVSFSMIFIDPNPCRR